MCLDLDGFAIFYKVPHFSEISVVATSIVEKFRHEGSPRTLNSGMTERPSSRLIKQPKLRRIMTNSAHPNMGPYSQSVSCTRVKQ